MSPPAHKSPPKKIPCISKFIFYREYKSPPEIGKSRNCGEKEIRVNKHRCSVVLYNIFGILRYVSKKLIKIITNEFWMSFKRTSNFFFYTFRPI